MIRQFFSQIEGLVLAVVADPTLFGGFGIRAAAALTGAATSFHAGTDAGASVHAGGTTLAVADSLGVNGMEPHASPTPRRFPDMPTINYSNSFLRPLSYLRS